MPEPTPSTPAPKLSWPDRIWLFLRSSVVGLTATGCDLISLVVMVRVFGWTPAVANVPSLVLGLIVIFIGNKYFAFKDRSHRLVRQTTIFLIIEAVAITLNILIFHWLVTSTALADYEWAARLIGSNITYMGVSYPLWNLFVFHYKAKPESVPPVPVVQPTPLATPDLSAAQPLPELATD